MLTTRLKKRTVVEQQELFPKDTHICKMTCTKNKFNEVDMVGELKLTCSSKEEVKEWINKYQNISLTTFTVVRNRAAKGSKVIYKVIIVCFMKLEKIV